MAVTSQDPTSVAERRATERRVAKPQLDMPRLDRSLPPRRERRVSHQFQSGEDAADTPVVAASCVACGYGVASHLTLSEPEHEVVTTLLNQREAPTLMRRSILRKLNSALRLRR